MTEEYKGYMTKNLYRIFEAPPDQATNVDWLRGLDLTFKEETTVVPDGYRQFVPIVRVMFKVRLLSVQIKSTSAVKPKFQWNLGSKSYDMPVLLLTGNFDQAFLLLPDDLARHEEKIKRNGGMVAYGVGKKRSHAYWKWMKSRVGSPSRPASFSKGGKHFAYIQRPVACHGYF